MDMFVTLDEYYDYLTKLIEDKPKTVCISTFGIYAGIMHDGRDLNEIDDRYATRTAKILDLLKDIPSVKILVGVQNYICNNSMNPCMHCESKFAKGQLRLISHAERWPNFEWRFIDGMHLKGFLALYDDRIAGVSGGRNFSDSRWDDVSLPLSDGQSTRLYEYFDKLWGSATGVSCDTIEEFLDREKISPKALRLL